MPFTAESFQPSGVARTPAGEYRIQWADGHASTYTLRYLRRECPCAGCREERTRHRGMVMLTGGPPADVQVVDVQPQGNYAIKFKWSDGHDTGIYSFQFLREACPCPACQALRPTA